MTETKDKNWSFGRFWETLAFFEIIPFIGCWWRLFGERRLVKNLDKQSNMKILVIGADSDLGREIIASWLDKGYSVTALIEEPANSSLPVDRVTIYQGDLNNPNSLKPEMMRDVLAVIDCISTATDTRQLNNLVDFMSPYLQLTTDRSIFDFTNPSNDLKEIWGALDDVVMGGVSASNLRLSDNRAIFTGIVSTDNNGGFASIRTRNFTPPLDLANYEGIQLRVIGDGKRYKFITRCEGKWDGIGYCYSFDTIYNFPTTINIPFADLIPVFRAKTVGEADKFDSSRIYSMQLMLSKFEYDGGLNPKFEAGSFSLQIEYIKAYGNKKKTQLVVASSTNQTSTESIEQILGTSGLTYQIILPSDNLTGNSKSIALQCLEAIK
jgi:hypothetical protein